MTYITNLIITDADCVFSSSNKYKSMVERGSEVTYVMNVCHDCDFILNKRHARFNLHSCVLIFPMHIPTSESE